MNVLKGTSAVVLGLVAVAVIGVAVFVGGWKLHWWMAKQGTENQYQVNTGTQQYQSALISQERDRVQAYTVATDPGQKSLIKSQFCTVYTTLTQTPADLVQADAQICS